MSGNPDGEFAVQNEKVLGLAVQEFRVRAGMTQEELAERLGEHRSYLSAVENGQSTKAVRTLMRAFRELGVEVVVRPKAPER